MNIVVLIKLVPDLVEELAIDESGTALDADWLRLTLNEFDDHAIEQAILLKEKYGGKVTVVAPDFEGVDDVLFAATARGADKILKLTGNFEGEVNNHALARAFAEIVKSIGPGLVLTGVQAHNDLDGSVGPLVAGYLDMPYVGYVAGVAVNNGASTVRKEYPGGLLAEMEITLPAVLGIQAAEVPPRYVAFSKIRQAMKTTTIAKQDVAALNPAGGPTVARIYKYQTGTHATIFKGDEDEVADNLIEIFKKAGVL